MNPLLFYLSGVGIMLLFILLMSFTGVGINLSLSATGILPKSEFDEFKIEISNRVDRWMGLVFFFILLLTDSFFEVLQKPVPSYRQMAYFFLFVIVVLSPVVKAGLVHFSTRTRDTL